MAVAHTTLTKDIMGTLATMESVQVPVRAAILKGDLRLPARAQGLVIFAHGSGSSRFSRRNRQVAEFLGERGFATLLLDLLTAEEEAVDVTWSSRSCLAPPTCSRSRGRSSKWRTWLPGGSHATCTARQ